MRTDRRKAIKTFEKSVCDLVEYAASHNVVLLIENNVVEPVNLINGENEMLLLASGEEISEFAARFYGPNFGMLIDVAHMNVSCQSLKLDREAFTEMVAPFTKALHLSDNDGFRDSNEPFDRSSWIVETLGAFEVDYVVIESYRLNKSQALECIDAVEFAYE
ncbi:hypothetical protein GCM10009069_05210 [Algimonas arctica]|uniref:Xylose isomerase-like TIM barrel domain-containing protein n=2 Tax=Algimonas arctica TaxID=1479486 RepID=A0A8J3G1C4_9PROT|nr:hypothetical protein GCM10009069_05210 [Algimonas arctica]